MDESYIPRISKMLAAGLTYSEIAGNTQFQESTVRAFIVKHDLMTLCRPGMAHGIMPQRNVRCYE